MRVRDHPYFLKMPGFGRGFGASKYAPGFYGICVNGDCSESFFMPGPREVVDLTGIAAGFRVIKAVKHVNVWMLATTNGTDTKIYRQETTWVVRATIASRVATDMVSFKSVLAVAFGSTNPYQFSTQTGAEAYTFTASTKTAGNSDSANYFAVQSNGRILSRVAYVTNPNELYFTEDLTNGDTTGSTKTVIGDTDSSNSYTTSITEDDTGKLIIGMRRALWSIGRNGEPEKLTEDFPDGVADAGGQGDRKNFESYTEIEGRIYYIFSGDEVMEYDHGEVNRFMAPKWQGQDIPRAHLPANAITRVGNKIMLAIGSANTATLKDVTHARGGTSRVSNQFTTASELYVGWYAEDPVDGQRRFAWHGVILTCTSLLRYMWFDEDTDYLYLSSGASESADLQQRRCLYTKDNALYHQKSSAIVRATGTAQLEILGIDMGLPFYLKRAARLKLATTRLGTSSSLPSMEPEYKITGDFDNTTFESDFVLFTENSDAATGRDFPSRSDFLTMDLRFVETGNGTDNTYGVLWEAELELDEVFTQKTSRPR